jgi:hypothetical protein
MLLVPPEAAEVAVVVVERMLAAAVMAAAAACVAAEVDGILAEVAAAGRGTLAAGPRHPERPRGQVSAVIVRLPSEAPPTVQITAGIPSPTIEARRSVRIDPAMTGMRACGPTRCAVD